MADKDALEAEYFRRRYAFRVGFVAVNSMSQMIYKLARYL